MRVVFCAAPLCLDRTRHTITCEPGCPGDWPREAAPGLGLCWPHHDQLARNALRAGEVYTELLLQLSPAGGSTGPSVSGSKDVGLDLNPRAVAARDRVAGVLTAWARLIVDERGFQPPASSPTALAPFVARSVSWLAAHPAAGDCYDELRELAYGEPYRVAFPSGTRVRTLGDCPRPECPGLIRVYLRTAESLIPAGVECTDDRSHQWPRHRYLDLLDSMSAVA